MSPLTNKKITIEELETIQAPSASILERMRANFATLGEASQNKMASFINVVLYDAPKLLSNLDKKLTAIYKIVRGVTERRFTLPVKGIFNDMASLVSISIKQARFKITKEDQKWVSKTDTALSSQRRQSETHAAKERRRSSVTASKAFQK